jgi:thioredoxin 1
LGKKTFLEIFGEIWYLSNMKKVIRLTESDLTRLVERIIKEQQDDTFMELIPGQIYEFIPVVPKEGDMLRYDPSTLDKTIFKMKIISFENKVLKGMVGDNKMEYDEKYFSTKTSPTQRYFCQRNNPRKCITDSKIGYTKKGQKDISQRINDFMGMDKKNSVFLDVTDDNFDSLVLTSTVPFLVDFSASWCIPCRNAAMILSEIKREYGDKFKMGKLDIDVETKTRDKYKISTIPVIMIFRNGEMIKRIDSLMTKEQYKKEIDSIL